MFHIKLQYSFVTDRKSGKTNNKMCYLKSLANNESNEAKKELTLTKMYQMQLNILHSRPIVSRHFTK